VPHYRNSIKRTLYREVLSVCTLRLRNYKMEFDQIPQWTLRRQLAAVRLWTLPYRNMTKEFICFFKRTWRIKYCYITQNWHLSPLKLKARENCIQIYCFHQKSQCNFATEPNRLMLFRETVAVYCENHTEHTNTLCGQNVEFCNIYKSSSYLTRNTLRLHYRAQPVNAV
jgi:hypothetical protein